MLLPSRTVQTMRAHVARQTTTSSTAQPTATASPSPTRGNQVGIIAGFIAIAAFITIAASTFLILQSLRRKHSNPRYIPTEFLKRKWQSWKPGGLRQQGNRYGSELQDSPSAPSITGRNMHQNASRSTQSIPRDLERVEAAGAEGIDRHVSLRSVMTLPAYSKSVRESEQLIAKEGERDGVDMLLEAPETVEEEEERREEEMESLYQIRVQRRIEISDREDRRTRRREARERGDLAEVARLRQESLLATQEREAFGAAAMITEHQSRSRERRVSSVNYADLGVARHDGTRVRANSNDSDRPLLDSAASMGGTTTRDSLSLHHRGRSVTSVTSTSDIAPESDLPRFGRSGSDFEIVTLSQTRSRTDSLIHPALRSRASSHVSQIETTDLGGPFPNEDPPTYDGTNLGEAPPYTSPVRQHRRSVTSSAVPRLETGFTPLPELSRLPSIRIAEATPIDPQAAESFSAPPAERRS